MDIFTLGGIAAFVATAMIFAVWLATRKRIAATTVGRAREEAERLVREATRDADTTRKEAELSAKEQAHTLLQGSERQATKQRDELAAIERQLTQRTEELKTHNQQAREADAKLAAREQRLTEQEQRLTSELTRCEELSREQSQALQRVSGLTADEAKDLIIRQVEQDARRDAEAERERLRARVVTMERDAEAAAVEKQMWLNERVRLGASASSHMMQRRVPRPFACGV
ncbi:MAG: hypothetical protein CMQ24_06155 [Gammaproteobacteria bacterium]|nr:hypothetical protein [Gammaproteobacteria bacterium]